MSYNDIAFGIESNYGKNMHTPGSSYYGIGQFSQDTATPFLSKMGKTWDDYLNDVELQKQVMDAETIQNESFAKQYGKENITDYDRWQMHNIGRGNWRKIQKGNVNDPNLLKAIRNQAGSPQTVEEYRARYEPKFIGEQSVPTPVVGATPQVDPAALATPEAISFANIKAAAVEKDRVNSAMSDLIQIGPGLTPNPTLPYRTREGGLGMQQLGMQKLGLGEL